MPMTVVTTIAKVTRIASGWVPHGTAPDIEQEVLNKNFLPVASFLLDDRDKEVHRDLRGGLVLPVDVLPPGDTGGMVKYATVICVVNDYAGYRATSQ